MGKPITSRCLFFISLIIIFFSSCKKDKVPNQIGKWQGNSVVQIMSGDSLYIYENKIELELRADEVALYKHGNSNFAKEIEWDLVGDDGILIYNWNTPANYEAAPSNPIYMIFNIIVDEKNYQEWNRYQESGSWWRTDNYTLNRID